MDCRWSWHMGVCCQPCLSFIWYPIRDCLGGLFRLWQHIYPVARRCVTVQLRSWPMPCVYLSGDSSSSSTGYTTPGGVMEANLQPRGPRSVAGMSAANIGSWIIPQPPSSTPLLPHTPTSIQCASLSRENRLKSRAEERLVYGDLFPFPVHIPFDHHVPLASHCSEKLFSLPNRGSDRSFLYIFPTSLFPCVRVSPCSNFPTSVILTDVFATTLRISFCLCTFNYLLPSSSGPCHPSNLLPTWNLP